jgi:hypothetical protein
LKTHCKLSGEDRLLERCDLCVWHFFMSWLGKSSSVPYCSSFRSRKDSKRGKCILILEAEQKWLISMITNCRLIRPGLSYKQSNWISGNPPSSSRKSLGEIPGEKPEGSMAARFVGATMEPSGFSPGVSQRELRELEGGFPEIELLCFLLTLLKSKRSQQRG